ncbi:hypothetical protein RND71_019580 [Anisodus tanguticus]|uniref:Uncharacterized protein n=1 Tax=Anisodus tanguticus TaxID=243964 RepID=A0AAE1RZ92_9SOLA|nr:hypothetical protein RND71_019580 [Anisodus tanguticus]
MTRDGQIAHQSLNISEPQTKLQVSKNSNSWERVLPSFNDTNIALEKARMIVTLMTRSRINMGEIIQDEIRDRIDRIDRYTEPKQTVDYTRLEYGNKRKTTIPQSQVTLIMLDIQILGSVDQHVPIGTSIPASTSAPKVPTPTTDTASTTSVATSSVPASGPGIPTHGMRLIFIAEANVIKLVEEFPAYVKEAIETTLAPNKTNLEAVREEQKSIKAQLQSIELLLGRIEGGGEEGLLAIRSELQRITTWLSILDPPKIVLAGLYYHRQQNNVENDANDKLERQSENESDSDVGDKTLESARSTVRAACIPPDEVDKVVAMQWFVEQLREQRAHGTSGASSSLAPPTHVHLPPSGGHVIPLGTSVDLAPALEIEPTG